MQTNEPIYLQDKVKVYLADRGIKKKWFAKKIGVHPSVLSQWFKGDAWFDEWKIDEIEKFIEQ